MVHLRHGLLYGLGLLSFAQHATAQDLDGPSPYSAGLTPDATDARGENSSFPKFEGISDVDSSPLNNATDNDGRKWSNHTAHTAKDFYLRIMPLGTSVVQGVMSSDGNGFRKLLRQQLRWKGWKVNMVGTKQDGTMADRDHEGHLGWKIKQIHDEWNKADVHRLKPNLVLINAGTNDCGNAPDRLGAGNRMRRLIDDILAKVPEVTIVVSTLVKSEVNGIFAEPLSEDFKNLVDRFYRDQRVGVADINEAMSMAQVGLDGIHPNDDGYRLFAAVWWDAISKLQDSIQPPRTDGLITDDSKSGDDGPIVSPGLPDYSSGEEIVQPSPGDEIIMRKTRNNLNNGTYAEDGSDVPVTVGEKLRESRNSITYDIHCGRHPKCQNLGNVVLKYYLDTDVIEDERRYLAKINELKAIVRTNNHGHLTLLTKWEGINFDKLPTWQRLSKADPQDTKAMNYFIDTAVAMASKNAQAYIRDHRISHEVIKNENILMKESDGVITEAHVINWEDAGFLYDEPLDDALEYMERQVSQAFYKYRPDDIEDFYDVHDSYDMEDSLGEDVMGQVVWE